MKCLAASVFLFCTFLPFAFSRHVQFFRKDYKYIPEYDAFYKLHWDVSGSTWETAFLTCDDEHASLFYPKVQEEWVLVKTLTEKMTKAANITDILVGLHDKFNLGEFITVDGHSTPYPLPADGEILANGLNCITMNIDTGKFSKGSCLRTLNHLLPFVCKKVDERIEESCPTVDQGYTLMKTLKKCYKISKKQQTWHEAMKTCFMEGGTLAVIENSEQANQIRSIIDNRDTTYFVGVRQLMPRGDYYSVRGTKFSDMYQNPYNNRPEPYDIRQIPNEYGQLPNENGQYPDENGNYPEFKPHIVHRASFDCGTVYKSDDLYTGTHNCDEKYPFICEMEAYI